MCARRNKEKELTLKEAIGLAKTQLTPQWYLSEPLLAGIQTEGKTSVVPLDESFPKKDWMILFVDITDFEGRSALWMFSELLTRYGSFELSPLIVIQAPYELLKKRETSTQLLDSLNIRFPHVVDWNGYITTGFQMNHAPGFVVWKQNIMRIKRSGPKWSDGLESDLQAILRETDPGLPLWLPIPTSEMPFHQRSRVELGANGRLKFPGPGFEGGGTSSKKAEFFPTDPEIDSPIGKISIVGKWAQEGDRIISKDREASIVFHPNTAEIAIFAEPIGDRDAYATLEIELNDVALPDVFAGEDIIFNEEGKSIVIVKQPGFYTVATKLSGKAQTIRIRFPHADSHAVALYGIRLAD